MPREIRQISRGFAKMAETFFFARIISILSCRNTVVSDISCNKTKLRMRYGIYKPLRHVYNSHIRVRKDGSKATLTVVDQGWKLCNRGPPLFIPPTPWRMPLHDCAGLSLRPVASVYCPGRSAGSGCMTRQYSTWRSALVTHCSSHGQPLEMNHAIH